MADTPLIYGIYSSKMYSIIPDGESALRMIHWVKIKLIPIKYLKIY